MAARSFPPVLLGGQLQQTMGKSGRLMVGRMMGRGEDARAAELHNLRLALATFALQLDAFEMRACGALLAAGREPSIAVRRTSRPRDSEGEMSGCQ
jgi:hypothetical protein